MARFVSGEGTNIGGFVPNAPPPPAGGSPNANAPPPPTGSSPNAPAAGGSAPNAPISVTASNEPIVGFASSAQKRINCKKKNVASGYGLFYVL